jgi:hypothetical protein
MAGLHLARNSIQSPGIELRGAARKAAFAGATKIKNTTGKASNKAKPAPSVSQNARFLLRTTKANESIARMAGAQEIRRHSVDPMPHRGSFVE